MIAQAGVPCTVLATGMILGGCAASYSPPPERQAAQTCLAGELWVCKNQHASRLPDRTAGLGDCRCETTDAVF